MLAELAYGLVMNPLPAHGAIMREATRLVEAGKIKVRLDPTTYTLAEVAAAHRDLIDGKADGKLVISVA